METKTNSELNQDKSGASSTQKPGEVTPAKETNPSTQPAKKVNPTTEVPGNEVDKKKEGETTQEVKAEKAAEASAPKETETKGGSL